jgi:RES domain-containing protein
VKLIRLHKTKYLASAKTGIGASLEGGRWNAAGTPLVYCSSSLSLATLEVLVHTKRIPRMLPRYSIFEVDVDDPVIETLNLMLLPPSWKADEPACVAIGQAWIQAQRSVGLLVPSAITAGEFNVVLNPRHPDFATHVHWAAPKIATFDERVFKASKRL